MNVIQCELKSSDQLDNKKYDLIVLGMTLHHIDDVEAILSLAASSLKPTGKLFIYDILKEANSDTFHGDIDLKVCQRNKNYILSSPSSYPFLGCWSSP